MKYSILAAAAAALLSGASQAATLYSNDFDGNEAVGAGVTVTALTNGGLESATTFGNWSGNYFANRSQGNPAAMSELSFTNLAPHTQVSATFLLGFLESWDGFDGAIYGPDNLDIYIDGTRVLRLTATNALGSADEFGGGTVVVYRGQINTNGGYSDTLIDMSTAGALTFAHTAASLTIAIQASGSGWQGADDEAWGVDALEITYDAQPVPEPSSWALMAAGAVMLGGMVRRRRARG